MSDNGPQLESGEKQKEFRQGSDSSGSLAGDQTESVGDQTTGHTARDYDYPDAEYFKNQGLTREDVEKDPWLRQKNGKGDMIPLVPGERDAYVIDFLDKSDPGLAVNWTLLRKARTMTVAALSAMVTAFGSAIISPGVKQIMDHFHVGMPVGILNISLYVLGFALGPVIWGPTSEFMGRKIPLVIALFGLVVFTFAAASSKDFQTLVLSRFFAGTFSAGTLAVAPVIPADMMTSETRGSGVTVMVLMIIAGPMLAPVVGGYISASFLGWRWTQYILGIYASLVLILVALLLEETYPPVVLAHRAKDIRHRTGNWAVVAPLETRELSTRDFFEMALLKPFKMLFVEPILFLLSVYHGFIYGILYLCLEAVPIIFGNYGWHGGNIYLPYFGMMIGTILVSVCDLFFFEPMFDRNLKKSGLKLLPEARLPIMMFCGILFPIGIFMLCWTGAYKVQWAAPTVGAGIIGFALVGIFVAAFNYIIDTYITSAASGIAANTFLRSAFGCAFPLFAHPMFINLETQWAGTLLGCIAVVLAPVPFCFYFFGKKIRQKSKYAFDIQ